jgi:hypothetical protein
MEPLSGAGHINDAEYECLYKEALLIVRERYSDVGEPYLRDDKRFCPVLGVPMDDHTIFELCWNEEIANQIARERTVQQDTKTKSPAGA